MPRLAGPRGLEGGKTWPVPHFILFLGKPAAQLQQSLAYLFARAPDSVPLKQGRRSLTEGAGMNVLGNHSNPSFAVKMDLHPDPAAARRRAKLGFSVDALKLPGS